MKNFLKLIPATIAAILLPAILLSSCATYPPNPNLPELMSEGDYYTAVENASQKKQIYDGLYENLEVYAIIVNSKVGMGRLDQNARIYQWDRAQYEKEKGEIMQRLNSKTEIILGVFVPNRKEDNLGKKNSVWKLFLDANGKRYEGTVTKIKALPAEIRTLYPEHSRFYTPYKLEFPVAVTSIENFEVKLTATGPVASASVTFPPMK